MELRDPFPVDLADPDDVRAKYEIALEQQAQAEELAAKWRARAVALAGAAGLQVRTAEEERMYAVMQAGGVQKMPHHSGSHARSVDTVQEHGVKVPPSEDITWLSLIPSRTERDIGDLVVDIVNQAGREMKAKEVHDKLSELGFSFVPNQVSNALHYAANRANPPRLTKGEARGMYGPTPNLISASAAEDQVSGTEKNGRTAPK